MPSTKTKPKGRYELKETLGEGGMGVVYRAYDNSAGRDVALKTIRDVQDQTALQLFRKECDKQKSINHPNIVDIYDIGEFEYSGSMRPYFTMPLLAGATLDKLIRNSSHRLTVERSVEIICSVCKGLQAAHERGLIHRDLKPSNIFVLDDDSVKIIDFGVAHLIEQHTSMGVKGTLLYMSPEQVQMKQLTPASDIFSLGVVCYETLTRRQPFQRAVKDEIVHAILNSVPVPACELNPAVSPSLSQVIHAAMAKDPWHRFASARDFADALQRALRNQPIERFDQSRIQPRIDRAQKALEEGEYEFAKEILDEIQAEAFIHSDIGPMSRQIEQALRAREIRRYLDSARRRYKDQEYQLALQKLQQVLDLDPNNAEALTLRGNIESERSAQQVEGWLRLSRQHLENHAYQHARQALDNVLQLKPNDSQARELLGEIDHQEQQYLRVRQDKERLHQAAVEALRKGEISSALSKLEKVLELDRQAPDAYDSQRSALYQKLYNEVRTEYDLLNSRLAEARKLLANHSFDEALKICAEYLAKYPGQALFQALKFDIGEAQRQELSAYIARIDREVESEPDLDRRVNLVEQALATHPNEHFTQALEILKAKRELVNSIVGKAQNLEERGQFAEAENQWEILRNVYRQYPGLDYELERVVRRKEEQARAEAKKRVVDQIDHYLSMADFARAVTFAEGAFFDFPDDGEIAALLKVARQGAERQTAAQKLVQQAKALSTAGQTDDGLEMLRRALALDERNSAIRSVLVDALLAKVRTCIEKNWRDAEPLLDEAVQLDPPNPLAKSLRLIVNDRKRSEAVDQSLSAARELQGQQNFDGAVAELDRTLASYPDEPRLAQLKDNIKKTLENERSAAAAPRPQEPTIVESSDAGAMRSAFNVTLDVTRLADAEPGRATGNAGTAMAREVQSEPTVVEPAPTEPPAALPEKTARTKRPPPALILILSATAIFLVVIIGMRVWPSHKPPTPVVATDVEVEIRIDPAEAVAFVDGKPVPATRHLRLMPGAHSVSASLDGYSPLTARTDVSARNHGPVILVLQPLPGMLRVMADTNSAQAFLDADAARELQDGQLALPEVLPGQHTLRISGKPAWEVATTIRFAAGQAPVPESGIAARKVTAVMVSSFRGKGRLYSSTSSGKVTLDGQPVGELAMDGLALDNLKLGTHNLSIGEGPDALNISMELGAAPTLIMSILSNQNVGNFRIEANEDGFEVFLNGRSIRKAPMGRRTVSINNRDVKQYTVRIEKPGFRAEPPQITADIRKGEWTPLRFTLTPLPTTATVQIKDAPPGTTVVFGNETREVGPDGTLSVQMDPGEQTIVLRKDGYEPRSVKLTLTAGQPAEVAGALRKKAAVTGTASLLLSPRNSHVTYRSASGPETAVNETNISLEEGTYTFRASAPGHEERVERVRISIGQTTPVDLRLKQIPVVHRVVTMAAWDQPGAWTSTEGWYRTKGGEFVKFAPPILSGRMEFTVKRKSSRLLGSARVRWFTNYVDSGNYDLFEIDKGKFSTRTVRGGQEAPSKQSSYENKGDVYQLRIDASAGELVTSIYLDHGWKELARGRNTGGKFGFYLPGNEEIWISNFAFHPGD